MIKKYIPKDITSVVWLISLAYYAYASVVYLTTIKDMSIMMRASIFLLFTTIVMDMKNRTGNSSSFFKKMMMPLYLIILFWVSIWFFEDNGAFSTGISHISFYLLPLLAFPIACMKRISDEQFSFSLFLVMLVAVFSYYTVFKELNQFQIGDNTLTAHLSASYLPVAILPCVLLSRNRLLHLLAWILCVVITFSSLKRGGIVSFVIAFAAYLFFYIGKMRKWYVKPLFLVISIFLVYELVLVFIEFDDSIGGITASRFEGFTQGGYENESRMGIYKELFDALGNSNVLELLFGHGYLTVSQSIASHFSAHNDFMEVLFDFGLVAFVLFICMHFYFIKCMVYLIRSKSELAPSYAVFYALLFVWSMVSIVLLYPIMLFMLIYVARVEYLIGREKKQLRLK